MQGKKLSKAAEADHDDDVSDEDEAAEVPNNNDTDNTDGDGQNTMSSTGSNNNNNNNNTQERRKSNSESKKIKLDRNLSVVTTMKSVGLKSVENNPEPGDFVFEISSVRLNFNLLSTIVSLLVLHYFVSALLNHY